MIKINYKKLLLLAIGFNATYAQAALDTGGKLSLGVQAERQSFKYEGGKNRHGGSGGGNIAFTYTSPNLWRFGLEGNAALGRLPSKVRTYNLEARGLFGVSLLLNQCTTLVPYTGIGYNFKRFEIRTSGADKSKLSEPDLYVPLGAQFIYNYSRATDILTTAEYNFLLRSHTTAEGKRIHRYKAGDGQGARASLKYINKFSDNTALSIGPFVQYMHHHNGRKLKGSPASARAPKSTQLRIGLGISYHF